MTEPSSLSVSTLECAEIRRRRRTDEKLAAIAAALGRTTATVSRHARGDGCSHDPAEVGVPVESDQPPWEGPVTAVECAEIRRRRREGEALDALVDDLGRSKGTVSRHARGGDRCSHGPEEVGPPIAGRITPEICAEIRQRRRDGETVAALADDLGQTEATVSRHSLGGDGCNHDPEEVGAPVGGETPRPPAITAEECAEIRRRRRDGDTLEEVAAALRRGDSAVARHSTGRAGCGHDPEVVGAPVTGQQSTGNRGDPVTPPECAAIRARRRAGQTLAEVADALDRGRATVSHHSYGGEGCDHDPDVVGPPVSGRTSAATD